MSAESYAKWWVKTKNKLKNIQEYDEAIAQLPVVKEPSLANQLLGGLYSKYSMVLQDLDVIVDQMTQVQKSFAVRKILDATANRLNELKEELTKLDVSEYHYFDGALLEVKLIPQLVEIIHPTIVFPREPHLETFWRTLQRGEDIYVPTEEELEAIAEGGSDAKKKGKKGKKVAVDPLAMLTSGAAKTEPATEPEEQEQAPEEEQPGEEVEPEKDIEPGKSITQVKSFKQSQAALRKEKRKARPCNRPKSMLQVESEMTEEEKAEMYKRATHRNAIKLIQAHERARQARLYVFDTCGGKVQSNHRKSKGRQSQSPEKTAEKDPEIEEAAATIIQSHWRAYLVRKRANYHEIRRRLLIGMYERSFAPKESKAKIQMFLQRRRDIRDQAIRDYLQFKIDERARVLRVVAPGLFEDIGDEIRQWFRDWYYTCKAFKDIPSVAEGGSILIMRCEVETPQQHLVELMKSNKTKKKEKSKKDDKKKDDKKKEDQKKKEKQGKEKAKKKKKGDLYEFEPERTQAMEALATGFDEYGEMFPDSGDNGDDMDQTYMDAVTEEKCYEVQMEVRPKVDELMRLELDILKTAIERDKWKAKKKKGAFKPKVKKGKKGKADKAAKGKKKGKKDPTGHRKVEDLFQELFRNGIIRCYPEVHIDEYPGDFSYSNWEMREEFKDPPATLADARQAVIMNCIIPLGAERMVKPKSVLITGPRESQLDILANGVFNDTRCVLFDLSAKNMVGKYPGKKGNKDLLHLITKMSKLLQPSIIYLEDAEKTFYKKVPKDEKEMDPKRVGKFLGKIIKSITPNDRVLVLGTSYYPFLAQAAKFKKIFQRIILVPRSDYGSVYAYWHELLMKYHAVDRNINLSCISTLTKYYPLPQIKNAVENILTAERIIALAYRPLHQYELLNALLYGAGPVDDKEWEKYRKFYAGTNLGRRRNKMIAKANSEAAKRKKKT